MTTTLIRGARLLGATAGDILIEDGRIAEVGTRLSRTGAEIVDADGLIVLPGLVDLHTHLREPGFEASETVRTGSRAAAAGGFTCVHAMANTSPVADTAGVVDEVFQLGRAAGYVDVRPIGAVTVGLRGERLSEIGAMARAQARVRVFSDDGKCVFDPLIMRRALEYVKGFGGVVAQHAQDPRLTADAQMNEGALSAELGLAGWPAVAEESIIARDVLLAEHVGARVHICHLTTAGAVDVVRWAKRRGIAVTAEVTPHHLLLTEDLVRSYDAVYKVNPPLRSRDDVEALRDALADGTIDIVATDHAPHSRETKEVEWQAAAFGMVGLETALSVVQRAMIETGRMTWADVARVMSSEPARIGRVADQGRPLAAGEPAHLTVVDDAVTSTIDLARLAGRSANSPYVGSELPGRVVATYFGGVQTVCDGTVVDISDRAGTRA